MSILVYGITNLVLQFLANGSLRKRRPAFESSILSHSAFPTLGFVQHSFLILFLVRHNNGFAPCASKFIQRDLPFRRYNACSRLACDFRKSGSMRGCQYLVASSLTGLLLITWNTVVLEQMVSETNLDTMKDKTNNMANVTDTGALPIPTWTREEQFDEFPPKVENVSTLVSFALSSWTQLGISKEGVESALLPSDSLANHENCFGVQYLQESLSFFTFGRGPSTGPDIGIRDLLRSRRRHILLILREAISSNKFQIGSFEAVFCLGDCVMSRKRFHPLTASYSDGYVLPADPLPIFTIVSCRGSMNIPFPMWDTATGPIDEWEELKSKLTASAEKLPWKDRIRQAIFRGDHRTCTLYPIVGRRENGIAMFSPKHGHVENASKCGRAALMYQSLTSPSPHLFNVSIRFFEWDNLARNYDKPLYVPMEEQAKFRYIIYAEGHCQWANRLRKLFFLGAVILFQDTECIEHYGMLLRPWVHYIPVDYWFRNLTKAVEWGESHPVETRDMINRMRNYGDKFLSREATVHYVGELMQEYSHLMLYTPIWRDGAVELDSNYTQ